MESELIFVISQMISILLSKDTESDSQPPSNFLSLTSNLISLVSSMDMDSEPEAESELISLIKKLLAVSNVSLSDSGPEAHFITHVTNMISLVNSIESDPDSVISSTELDPDLMYDLEGEVRETCRYVLSLLSTMDSDSELVSLFNQIANLVMDTTNLKKEAEEKEKQEARLEVRREMEPKLMSLISQLISLGVLKSFNDFTFPQFISVTVQIISLLSSKDLYSLPKPESELMSLIMKTIFVYNTMTYHAQPLDLWKLISDMHDVYDSYVNSRESDADLGFHFMSLVHNTLRSKPESELISSIHQIFYLIISMNPELQKLISLSPQVRVESEKEKFNVIEEDLRRYDLACLPLNWEKVRLTGENIDVSTHFRCTGCNGDNHTEHEKAPDEVKHLLHLKHTLLLVSLKGEETRKCYCCDEDLKKFFYYCISCDFAMNVACGEKQAVLYKDHPRWHEHTLALFPRQASLTCNLCALADSSSPIYMCPPCDFVTHLRCINLPRVIRISRHFHRISFTPSFDNQVDWSCGVCRRKINSDYGGYVCNKDGCTYAAHSRCATQKNVWDGIDLEGEPEEVEEEVIEPFVTISDGVIQHFSHPQHHLRLDENTTRSYKESNQCQACITPIYFGNFYSCMQCDYILHEECAKLSHKLYHPIHPHKLNLVVGSGGFIDTYRPHEPGPFCSACPWMCIAGFFYECGKVECQFRIHVQCATVSEPLIHGSHILPLFLTSKPGEQRICSVCKKSRSAYKETFNCIESDFSLCFGCATLPQKVRYKHDKHILTLSYGKDTSKMMMYWCEVCEGKLNPKKRFYMCDEYCCITLHIKCLIGKDLYMKPGASWVYYGEKTSAVSNYQHMSRPFCSKCEKRCLYRTALRSFRSESIFCSRSCIFHVLF